MGVLEKYEEMKRRAAKAEAVGDVGQPRPAETPASARSRVAKGSRPPWTAPPPPPPGHFEACLQRRLGAAVRWGDRDELLDARMGEGVRIRGEVACDRYHIADGNLNQFANNDAAALYGAFALADYASEGPVSLPLVRRAIALEAVAVSCVISPDRHSDADPDKLFPSGWKGSTKSTVEKYETEAIGSIVGDELRGCLLQWGVAVIVEGGRHPRIGISKAGAALLGSLRDLTLRHPHNAKHAGVFLGYLSREAPVDLSWLMGMCQLASRRRLHSAAKAQFKTWGGSPAADAAGAYLSRARAWRLIHPDSIPYELTPFGKKMYARYKSFVDMD